MQQRVMNYQLEWELSQRSLNLMGQHSSLIRKVSAKRFPREAQAVLLDFKQPGFLVVSIEKGPCDQETLDHVRGWSA